MKKIIKLLSISFLLAIVIFACKKTYQVRSIAKMLEPTISIFDACDKPISIKLTMDAQIKEHDAAVNLTYSRIDANTLFVDIEHKEFPAIFYRDDNRNSLILPKKQTLFTGTGKEIQNLFAPTDIFDRIISEDTKIYDILELAKNKTNKIAFALSLNIKSSLGGKTIFSLPNDASLEISKDGKSLTFINSKMKLTVDISYEKIAKPQSSIETLIANNSYKVTEINRGEIETLIFRGLRRFAEVVLPSKKLTEPKFRTETVENGKLFSIEGYRVAILKGSPEQIGAAHGKLLAPEANKLVDSLLYMVGLAQTVREGEWLPAKIAEAYNRLAPFIPNEHIREIDAMADAAGLTQKEARLASVFPELFHCSGFALTGEATADGKLYHGRILDYMTKVGLHDATTIFFVKPDGKNAFANIGYAGFIGCVSGMNEKKISVGEMGGKGEGNWDGIPMATLMRIGLEECDSLGEVKELWQNSPRTCEYFYVLADGNIKDALGVAATPEYIDFIGLGEFYKLLGEGTKDSLLLSKGDRLAEMKKRVHENFGKFDVEKCQWLMTRPVAMKSNLHNVLFVPEDGLFYVAHASHNQIAANMPYVKFNLEEMFGLLE